MRLSRINFSRSSKRPIMAVTRSLWACCHASIASCLPFDALQALVDGIDASLQFAEAFVVFIESIHNIAEHWFRHHRIPGPSIRAE